MPADPPKKAKSAKPESHAATNASYKLNAKSSSSTASYTRSGASIADPQPASSSPDKAAYAMCNELTDSILSGINVRFDTLGARFDSFETD